MKAPSIALLHSLRPFVLEIGTSRPSTALNLRLARSANRSRRHQQLRSLGSSRRLSRPEARTPNLAPRSRERGPASNEDTQTDFGALNVLATSPPPATAIDACLNDGFHFSNGVKITGGSGCLLIAGEVFSWNPWKEGIGGEKSAGNHTMLNAKGQWEIPQQAWGVLELVWPKPELLIVGMGDRLYPLAPATRKAINDLGIRVDVLDTRNASAQFNLLATERGVSTVAAALIPIGQKLKPAST